MSGFDRFLLDESLLALHAVASVGVVAYSKTRNCQAYTKARLRLETPRNAISFNCSTSRFPLQAEARMICATFQGGDLIGGEVKRLDPQVAPSRVIGGR